MSTHKSPTEALLQLVRHYGIDSKYAQKVTITADKKNIVLVEVRYFVGFNAEKGAVDYDEEVYQVTTLKTDMEIIRKKFIRWIES